MSETAEAIEQEIAAQWTGLVERLEVRRAARTAGEPRNIGQELFDRWLGAHLDAIEQELLANAESAAPPPPLPDPWQVQQQPRVSAPRKMKASYYDAPEGEQALFRHALIRSMRLAELGRVEACLEDIRSWREAMLARNKGKPPWLQALSGSYLDLERSYVNEHTPPEGQAAEGVPPVKGKVGLRKRKKGRAEPADPDLMAGTSDVETWPERLRPGEYIEKEFGKVGDRRCMVTLTYEGCKRIAEKLVEMVAKQVEEETAAKAQGESREPQGGEG